MEKFTARKFKVRRRHDVEETRQALLRAAATFFAKHGFAAANVREIARAADATSPLINRYFGGKEGLYLEVHRQMNARAVVALRQGLADLGDSPPQADVVFRILAKFYRDNPAAPRLEAWWLLERGDLRAWPDLPSSSEPFLAALADCQSRGGLREGLRVDHILTLSVALAMGWAALRQHVCTATGEQTGEGFAQVEESFLEQTSLTLLQGLCPDPTRSAPSRTPTPP